MTRSHFQINALSVVLLIQINWINKSFASSITGSIENHIGHKINDNDLISPFSNQFIPDTNCHKPTQKPCEPLLVQTCFGVKLPYSMTSTELVSPSMSQVYAQYKLKQWEGLKALPKCWAVIQPLLCSVYMPKCQNGSVELPPQEICKITRSPCKAVEQAFLSGLPDFLKCGNYTKFPTNCKTSSLRELRFNVSIGNCTDPMIEVPENSLNEYKGFDGCGLKCQDLFFDNLEHQQMSSIIFYAGITSLVATGWVVLTYLIGWKASSYYPPIIIFYVNVSYFIATLGWMFQFLPKAKEGIVCRGDATLRKNEYSSGETVSCTFVFILIYWGSMCALNWLVIFAYTWNQTCHAVGRIREEIEKKSKNFHLSWLLATLLTIASYLCGNVGGNSMTGICFIGYFDPVRRIIFLLVPVGVKICIISFFMWRGVYSLYSLSSTKTTSDYITNQGKVEIKRQTARAATFTALTFILTLLVFWFEISAMLARPSMEKSLRETLLCRLNLTEGVECEPIPKPGLFFHGSAYLFFVGGLLVSSGAWTSESAKIWKRFFSRLTGSNTQSSSTHKGHKHRLIAQAFSKRKDIVNGRLSLSIGTSRGDPLGLNKLLDPNHIGKEIEREQSQCLTDPPVNISSEWAANLPHLVARRGGIIPPHSSNSVSCVSDDSRRPSCDSAAAMSELAARNLQGGSQSDLDDKRRSKRRWYDMGRRNRHGRMFAFGRRGMGGSNSSVSSASNAPPQILPAITALIDKKLGQNGKLIGLTQVINQLGKPLTREFAIQTSIEKLHEPRIQSFGIMCDKETQSSIKSLHEIGVQTKKSATKKREKESKKIGRKDEEVKSQVDSQVLKLLSPN